MSVTCSSLYQVELFKIMLQNGVFDGYKDKADVLCIRGAGEVGVDFPILVWVLFLVHLQDELLRCFSILLRT